MVYTYNTKNIPQVNLNTGIVLCDDYKLSLIAQWTFQWLSDVFLFEPKIKSLVIILTIHKVKTLFTWSNKRVTFKRLDIFHKNTLCTP